MKTIKAWILFIFILSSLLGQNFSIKGIVVDEKGQAISGANIYLKEIKLGCTSLKDGSFLFKNIPLGQYTLVFSVIGYKEYVIEIDQEIPAAQDLGTIQLDAVPLKSKPIFVTASKYEQNLTDIPASLHVISTNDLNYRNIITIDEALKYTPGINMNGSQVNIRGSNGYSYGVGSRVMMLIDGIPYLTGDTQEANMESIPVNQIERIEILKGSGSALYGSNAIGGVINIISKDIPEEPVLGIKIYGGFYDEPYYDQWKWSDKTRYLEGLKINFSRKINNAGISLFASRDLNDGYKMNDWRRRYHFGGSIQYDLSNTNRIKVSATYMDQKRGHFLFWKDFSNALIPIELGQKVHSKRYHISTVFRHTIDDKSFYKVQAIWYHNQFDDNITSTSFPTGNESKSDFMNCEFQYTKKINKHTVTSGINGSYNSIESSMFGNRFGDGLAVYAQDEISITDKLSTTLGMRYDYFHIDSARSGYQFNPKIGIVYKANQKATFRSSCGTGYRGPSVSEAFTSTMLLNIVPVIPNLDLKPERSISFESGYHHIWSKHFISDLAVFYNEYWDLIEGTFLPSASLEIQFRNVAKAKIYGYELNVNGLIFKDKIGYYLGFTQVEPRDEKKDDYLSFRPRYLLYTGSSYRLNIFRLGVDYRYISRYDRIDLFDSKIYNVTELFPDAEKRGAAHVVDLRLSAGLRFAGKNIRTTFHINNLLQYHYIEIIGAIAPIRNYVLTIDWKF